MSGRAATLAQLRELRKSGKSRLSSYQVEEAQDLYDEVDEEGYKKVVRGRLDQDDFVVDDNGVGYADDGREEWNEKRPVYETDSEEDAAPLRGKAAKRKREEDAEKNARNNASISNYFNGAHAKAAPKAKAKAIATDDDAAFMADLLGDINAPTAGSRRAPMKPVKNESRRKTRILSPPVSDLRKVSKHMDGPSPIRARENTSPVPLSGDEGVAPALDDDLVMSDNIPPSSPIARAVERKAEVPVKKEEESDDDMMEVAAVTARTSVPTASVNIKGSRPAPKVMKKQEQTDYPTPESSSPTRSPHADTIDASSWNAITSKLNVLSSPNNEAPTIGKLQPKDAVEEDGSLRFFWMDYMEMNGSLLLFGKVKNKASNTFVSAFVKVDNILRKLYFLPREHKVKNGRPTDEEVDMGNVYEEVDGLMSKYKVNMHKIKPCERKYAFEMADVPRTAEYLKLLYPYDKPPLPLELQGETFSRVFGTNTSIFEQFVLWKNVMGPCWLKIEDANFNAVQNASWCKLELQVTKPNNITTLGDTDNLEAPPLTLMSISLRSSMNVKANKQEIIMASARIYENIHLSDTTSPEKLPCKTITILRPPGHGFPIGFTQLAEKHAGAVRMEKSEAGVLSLLMAHVQKFDPDVFIGHKLEEDYSMLLSRLKERNIPGWHRMGRLRRSEWPKNMGRGGGSFFVEKQIGSGRLYCDLANDMGKSMMTKCQSWSLAEMCELVLGKGNVRREIDNETALKTWATDGKGLMNYVRHAEADTYFVAAIALKVQMLPLTKVLTNLAGNSWARTLSGTRAERNEYILLHEFTRNKYICPDKVFGKAKKDEQPEDGEEAAETKKKDKYKGGLVFEPEKGLYDRVVLVMDFNSLYPSIIQEYNICFTTVERSEYTEEDEGVPEAPQADQELGILPRLIAKLVNRRREVKKLMKDKTATTDQLATWDIKQLALKLTANSMYGCLGYTKSRFYARPLAVLTTFKGREILRSTKELAETKQLQVIYGDTDSVMINTNVDNIQEALKVGNDFKRSVNERYKLLEIDIDNVFRRVLLHAKKKYAAINMVEVNGKFVEKLEVKGLDMRRREYCALSKETSTNLLNMLLSGEEPEVVVEKIHDYLRELSEKMRQFEVPANKYTIFTQLSKNPQDYPNAKSMPAVQVALKRVAKGENIRAKDVMSFIICGNNNGSQEAASSHAYPQDEVLKSNTELKPDIDYYLHKQILPPVERLCQPITFTNITRLAECLGLDTSKYRISTASGSANPHEELIQPLDSQVPDHIRFKDCAPLQLLCLSCRNPFTFRALDEDPASVSHSGLQCPSPACHHRISTLTAVAQVEHNIRQLCARAADAWLVCDDPDCGARTRQASVYAAKCLGPHGLGRGCTGRMAWELSEKQLYNQLLYWERAWDVAKTQERVRAPGAGAAEGPEREKMAVLAEVNRARFETLRRTVRAYLDKSGRQWVDMGSLFRFAAV